MNIYNSSNFLKFPIDSGMVPLKLLLFNFLFYLNIKKNYY